MTHCIVYVSRAVASYCVIVSLSTWLLVCHILLQGETISYYTVPTEQLSNGLELAIKLLVPE